MYDKEDFLELYRQLERWAEAKYGDDGVKGIENSHHDRSVQQSVRYFRYMRNNLSHNPNGAEDKQMILLTDEFRAQFEALCNKLMGNIAQIAVPYKEIFKREMSDRVLPTIKVMRERVFTHVPVMNGKKVWGVFSESAIFNLVGDGEVSLLDDDLPLFKIGKYVSEYSETGVFDFVGSSASIDDINRMFSEAVAKGRRLDVIYITTTGDQRGDLVGMVTVWDIK